MDAVFENKNQISGQQKMITGLRLRDHCGGCYKILFTKTIHWPIPKAARSKALVCGYSLAAIMGSNRAGEMVISLL